MPLITHIERRGKNLASHVCWGRIILQSSGLSPADFCGSRSIYSNWRWILSAGTGASSRARTTQHTHHERDKCTRTGANGRWWRQWETPDTLDWTGDTHHLAVWLKCWNCFQRASTNVTLHFQSFMLSSASSQNRKKKYSFDDHSDCVCVSQTH